MLITQIELFTEVRGPRSPSVHGDISSGLVKFLDPFQYESLQFAVNLQAIRVTCNMQ